MFLSVQKCSANPFEGKHFFFFLEKSAPAFTELLPIFRPFGIWMVHYILSRFVSRFVEKRSLFHHSHGKAFFFFIHMKWYLWDIIFRSKHRILIARKIFIKSRGNVLLPREKSRKMFMELGLNMSPIEKFSYCPFTLAFIFIGRCIWWNYNMKAFFFLSLNREPSTFVDYSLCNLTLLFSYRFSPLILKS